MAQLNSVNKHFIIIMIMTQFKNELKHWKRITESTLILFEDFLWANSKMRYGPTHAIFLEIFYTSVKNTGHVIMIFVNLYSPT